MKRIGKILVTCLGASTMLALASCGSKPEEAKDIVGLEINGNVYVDYISKGTELNKIKFVYSNGKTSDEIAINENSVKGYNKDKVGTQILEVKNGEEQFKLDLFVAERVVSVGEINEFYDAIGDQKEGDFIKISNGIYDIDYAMYDVDKTFTIEGVDYTYNDFYMLLNSPHVKVSGSGSTVLKSTVYQENGAWSFQNFVTVDAEDVTLDNLYLISKTEVNKCIEAFTSSKDFRLTNAVLSAPEDPEVYGGNAEKFAGSVYFNATDIGNVVIDNVKLLKGRFSFSGAQKGSISFNNTKINYTKLNDYLYGYDGAFTPFGAFKDKELQIVNPGQLEITLDKTEWEDDVYAKVLASFPDGVIIK